MDIKDNIKTLCKLKGRTFAELANDLNVTRQTLFRQVTGNTTTDTLKRIANALNVPPFILLHPDPARAMKVEETGHAPGPDEQTDAPARSPLPTRPPVPAVCPVCHTRLFVSIHAATDGQTPMEPDEPGPEILTSDSRKEDRQTNRQTDEGPEEMKLF